jgi:hypothetical protein
LTKRKRAAGLHARQSNDVNSADSFRCRRCHGTVATAAPGTGHRNHCPHCLWSLHVDVERGDRASSCRRLMEPVGVWVKTNGEWSIFHRCEVCQTFTVNRIAGDDSQVALLSLALRPIAFPPFPLTKVAADFVSPLEAVHKEVVSRASGTRGSRDVSGCADVHKS